MSDEAPVPRVSVMKPWTRNFKETFWVTADDVKFARRVMVYVHFSALTDGWVQVSKTAMYQVLKFVTPKVEGEFDKAWTLWIGDK
jgi:hypothetical protein